MNKFLNKLQNVTVKSLILAEEGCKLTADILNGDKSISINIEKKATKSKK